MNTEGENTTVVVEKEAPPTSYVEQQAADFVLFCNALEIDAQPDDDLSCH